MLELQVGDYQIKMTDVDAPYAHGSADNSTTYDQFYHFGDKRYATSQYAIRLMKHGKLASSCLLASDGGPSSVHPHSAVISGGRFVVVVGPCIAAITIPTLHLLWVTQVDDVTCFGVHAPDKHDCLISHGELSVARLDHAGQVIWQADGADIFTGDFRVDGDVVRAIDFNDREYAFDIQTGKDAHPQSGR